MTEHYTADADPQNISEPPTDDGYMCSDPIIPIILMTRSARDITSMIGPTKVAG